MRICHIFGKANKFCRERKKVKEGLRGISPCQVKKGARYFQQGQELKPQNEKEASTLPLLLLSERP